MIKNVVTIGDGLYKDSYEEGRYIYKGSNVNNWNKFNEEDWSVLSVEENGSIKIVKEDLFPNRMYDSNSNNWDKPTDIKTYLNG